jgi:signal transduction histidine kinase
LSGSPAAGRRDAVFVAVPVRAGADTVGVVLLMSPTALVESRADDKLRGLAVVGLISLAAAVIAALFMAGTLIGPIRRLQRSTERVAAGDFDSPSATGDGPPEVRHLATSFNAMTDRIAQLLEQQRSFASDASHQLRTPLTALRLQLERAAETVETDPAGARGRLEAAGVETERLQRMVEGLLLLARSDTRSSATETVDAGLVASERAEIWRPLAAERNITVDARVAGDATARAVPGALEQIIDNYLDNAITIAPDNSVVDVVVGRKDGWVEIHVLDRGPGLSTEQIEHVFDRFWRAPDAPHEGSGLGLAIVRHLASASGGSVTLTNRLGGGIDAGLRLVAGGAQRSRPSPAGAGASVQVAE